MKNSKKLVNLISLVVLVATNILSPLSYATAGEEDIGSVSDIVSYGAEGGSESESYDDSGDSIDDSDMEEDSSAEASDSDEGDVDSPSEPHPTPLQTPSKSSPDRDDLGDFQSLGEGSSDEIGTGEVDNNTPMDSNIDDIPQNDEDTQNDEIHEGEVEGVWIIDTIKSFMPDDIRFLDEVSDENSSEIVESEEIYGTGEYEGVKVEVYAQTGAFALGTILNIIPITGDDEMSDIQDVLEQQKNVEKSQKVIAFDITFLDPETEEELQPLMTGAVQVTFNYEENDELVAAEENEEQEVKVYHLNDKDEEGEKIESITGTLVEDVEVNEEITEELSEEIENVVVVNAESFSYYTIVVQRREEAPESNPTQTWQYGEDYFTISIARPSSLDNDENYANHPGFTIMDRNLGATATGYGDISTASTDSYGYLYQWGNNYGFPYSAASGDILTDVGLQWNDSYNDSGYVSKKFINGKSFNNDVWNNSGHYDDVWGGTGDNATNWWGSKLTNYAERQGPCPEGWHVPSAGEWGLLIKYWGEGTGVTVNGSNGLFYLGDKYSEFQEYFKLPFAGYRLYSTAGLKGQGSYGLYWSSSPYGSDNPGSARSLYLGSSYVRADDYNLRAYGLSVRCFKDSYVASPETSNIVDTQAWVEGKDFETITISNPDNINEGFTIMDRNLGASISGTVCDKTNNTGACGYLYQWGNNYGFPITETVTPVTTGLTWNNVYNNHGYFSTNFINGSSHDYDVWDGTNPTANNKEHHDGVWGGANDNASNGWGVDLKNYADRQGPCPSGWHVPSAGEWGLLVKYWRDTYATGVTLDGSNNLYYISGAEAGQNFMNYFNIPFAGFRYYSSAGLYYQGSEGYYWSSSPYGSYLPNHARRLYLSSSKVLAYNDGYRVNGISVRCFKDSYVAPKIVTFNLSGGYWTESGTTYTQPRQVTYFGDEEGSLTNWKTPSKEPTGQTGWMFDGWYLSNGARWTGNVTSDMTVYAHWLPFEDLVVIADDGTKITVMDRNLGATAAGTECSTSDLSTCGYHFQWGNNYGFKPCTSSSCTTFPNGEITGDTARDAGDYAASTYYGSKFRLIIWSSVNNPNLWGGSGDTKIVNGAGTEVDRQGPCPDGYHVPSTKEWNDIYTALGLSSNAASVTTLMTKFKLPFVGNRNYWSASTSLQDGYYWSSSFGGSDQAYYLRFASTYISPQDFLPRANGFSVRCFKNAPEQFTVTFNSNGGTTATGSIDVISGTTINLTQYTATKTDYEFIGWNINSGATTKIGDSYEVNGDVTLYAIFNKIPSTWTIESGDFRALDITGADGKVLFTIMDRNLGAEAYMNEDGKTASQWYGKYYQWGNNYGFTNDGNITVDDSQVDASEYGPNHYYNSSTFIYGNGDGDWSSVTNNNLWGGENTSNPDSRRQGPCPDGYHVPDTLEWKAAISLWCTKKIGGASATACSSQRTQLQTDLLLPSAGNLNLFSSLFDSNRNYYWSSSPQTNVLSYNIDLSNINLQDSSRRAYGFPVRCFQNTTGKTITYVLNNGTNNPSNPDSTVRRWEEGTTLLGGTRNGYTFKGWYTNPDFTGDAVTTNAITDDSNSDTITLYAKWQDNRCVANEEWYDEIGACATKSDDGYVYYWTDENNKDVISIKDPDSNTILTILDKNEGASVAGTSYQSYGYHYQRGNNTPFKMTCASNSSCSNASNFQTDTYANSPAIYQNFWPGHPYTNSTFIYGNGEYWSGNKHYDVLWGGLGDVGTTTSVDTFWGGIKNGDTRQGPCDSGYHVPSMGEWNALITYWYNTKNPSSKKSLTGLNGFSDGTFKTDFKLPLAGYRDYSYASLYSQGSFGYYWSSSPDSAGSSKARSLVLDSSYVDAYYNYRAHGYSVRCFKDSSEAPETLTLTFDENGGDLLGASGSTLNQLVASGKLAQQPVEPTKVGYTFTGWTTERDGNTVFNFSNPITADKTLYARWEVSQYTVTFNSMGGGEVSSQSVVSGEKIIYPQFPDRDGFMFDGWYTEEEGGKEWLFYNDVVTGDMELFARWIAFEDLTITLGNTEFVILDRNLGASSSGTGTSSYGNYYQWGNNYGFKSIGKYVADSTSVGNSGPGNYYIGQVFYGGNINANTYYGRDSWFGYPSNLSFYQNLWGDITNTDIARQGPCPIGYHVPSLEDWTNLVNGYNTRFSTEEGKNICGDSSRENCFSNLFLIPFAGFISPHSEGRLGTINSPSYQSRGTRGFYGSSTSYMGNTGGDRYKFKELELGGYKSVSIGENYLVSSSSIRCFKNNQVFDKVFTVNYETNGGSNIESIQGLELSKISKPANPTKERYEFDDWYKDENLTSKWDFNSDVLIDNITLYAEWKCADGYHDNGNGECIENIYIVNYNANLSGVDNPASGTVTYGLPYGELPNLSKTGYIFTGWYDGEELVTSGTIYTNTGNTDLIARWTCDTENGYEENGGICVGHVTISFETNGGLPKESIEILEGTKIVDKKITKYSHTPNINDDGLADGVYENNLSITDTVTIGGADSMHVDMWYSTQNRGSQGGGMFTIPVFYDYVEILDKNGNIMFNNNSTLDPGKFCGGANSSTGTNNKSFDVEDDTIKFRFTSNGSLGYYGYYAVIQGTGFGAGDAIRPGYTFEGWYTEGGDEFDSENTAITDDITLYAKWQTNCPEGEEYAETDGQCYPSRAIIRDSVSGEIIQINDMEWDDLELYFLGDDDTNVPHFTIMDRNLGATEVYNGHFDTTINRGSLGYHYQWGNNYGFASCWNGSNCSSFLNGDIKGSSSDRVDKSIWEKYIPSQYARKIFFTSSSPSWMSGSTTSDGIWGGTGDTADYNGENTTKIGRQGPCPDGYYIPSTYDWGQILNTRRTIRNLKTTDNEVGIFLSNDLLLPPSGQRLNNNGNVESVTTNGKYWASSPDTDHVARAKNISFQESLMYSSSQSWRDFGYPIRCVKNYPTSGEVLNFTLHANGGTGAVIAFTGSVSNGRFTSLGTPNRGTDTFDGWYDAQGNKLGVGSGVVSDIYARFVCESGYIDLMDGSGCVKSEATLLPGPEFNIKVKNFVNNSTSYSNWSIDSKINKIYRSNTLPGEGVNTIVISADGSLDIIAWYDNGILYYYTQADTIYLNENSNFMFGALSKLSDISTISSWNTTKVTDMGDMFYDLELLTDLSILSGWDTSKVTNMSEMFYLCYDLKDISGIKNWDTSKVTDMNSMFEDCDSLEIVNLTGWDVSSVTDMTEMFGGSDNLKSVDLSGWNASSLTTTYIMFSYCENLKSVNLSNWDVRSLISTEEMFWGCFDLENANLDNWKTRDLEETNYMFQECEKLKTIDLSSWDTKNLKITQGMFWQCESLESINLANWDTSKVTDMSSSFDDCPNLKTIYASSGFVVNEETDTEDMFWDAENIIGGNGTLYDENFEDGTYAKIDNENQTGYFTDPSHFAIRFRNLSGDEIATQWISTGGTATGLVKNYASFSYYTDSGATTPYDFTKKLYAYSEVYADMSCDDGYTEVNGECIQQFTVEFEAYTNGGLVNMSGNLVASGSIKVASGTEINLSDYVAVNDPTSYIGDGWVFDGWGTIPERQFKITSPTLVITGDITLHALFYKIYESYFELQDINAGTLSSNTGYCTGYNGETSCDLIIPTFIENDGYIFDGFSNSQGSTGTIDIYTIGNTYYTVTHETTPISVTFNVNGNSGTTETRECYKYNGSDICLIKSPDITPAIGFTKIGWSTDVGTHTNEWNVNTLSGVSANSTYYAQSKKDKVTLNISYGTGVGVSSISKISDSCDLAEVWNGTSQATSCTVTAPDITLKSGYGTGVWTKDTNPSVIKNPGDDIELTSNDSYTASAIATVYPISYHENGGTLVGQKTSYTVEEDFTLVTPNRDSYVFEGWTGSNGDNPQKTVTVNSGTVTGPLNYYANWTPITYTIAFNGNAVNVEGTQSSMDATYDSGDTAPESNFTRPGYTFTSWNTQSDGNGINYDTGSELKNLTNTSGDVVTLYAIWQANTDTPYTVHYYLENIDDENYTFDSTDGKAGTTDDEISIDTLKKEITGAHFEKAAVVVSNQGPEYGATTTVDNITISGDGNTEVYLFYKRNTHTVTAIAGEGVGSVSGAGTYKYGQTVTLTPGNINSCYTANSKTFIMPDNDVQETLNGVIKKFTVTLNKDSHISSVQGNGEYNCGVEVNVSATPNVGYEFVRWEKNSTQVSAQSSYTFTITESVVLNAVSKAQNGITYTVRHWIRDVGANTYAKYSEESKSGETDSPITLENEKISVPCGTYAEGKENGTVKTTTIIKGDGSTVIDLYYSRNSYTVTISKDSGILSVSNSASHECGAGVTITATPKTGYSFNRYSSTDVDSSTNNPYTFTMPDKAVSIQAQSNANTYTVNFNANGGTGTMSQQTFTYDISQQLSDNLFTRTGYIFTGWSIDSGATVPTYTNKQSVDNLATTGSITLYAIWTTKGTSTKYTVRHIKQGLSTPTDDVVETQELYAETNSVQTPAVKTYSGFNSPSVGNITVSANGNASIDYVYTRKNITLTLDKDNGTQNSTITGKYGANVQKPTSNPQKTGYTFTGWSPNIPDTFPAISGTHVAQYTLDTYTITYNLNGGINHIDNPTTYTYLSGDITLKAPTRDGYVFSGWMGTDVNSVTKTVTISTHSEGNRSYTAVWGEDRNHDGIDDDSELKYTVTINYVYSRGGTAAGAYTTGNQLSGFTYNVDSPIITNYHADKTNVSGTITGNVEVTVTYTPDHDTNNNGIADEEESITPTPAPSGGSSSSGGGGGGKKPTDGDSHGSASDKDSGDLNKTGENPIDTPEESKGGENLNEVEVSKGNSITDTGVGKTSDSSSQGQIINYLNGSYTKEQVDAYNFAKSNGITTMPTIQQAKMNTSLTRIQMAKMLSNFAINVMKQEPDPEKGIVKFNDVTNKMDKQYDNAVTKAYQLGIMGQNMKNNEFRPNDEVTRAEFASALSRLLYQTDEGKYKSTGNYYIPHITRLYQEGIINNTNPKLKEKRGYVMLMLMRTVQ